MEGVVHGFYSISFIDPEMKVRISCDDSAVDVARKLKLLPSIGNINVALERGDLQVSWTVSFLSNTGDLEMLQIHYPSSIIAVSPTIHVDELVKGASLPNHIQIPLLPSENSYIARIAAMNEAGIGEFTSDIAARR